MLEYTCEDGCAVHNSSLFQISTDQTNMLQLFNHVYCKELGGLILAAI